MFGECLMTIHSSGIDADDKCAGIFVGLVTVAESTGFFRADTAFIFRIKKDDQLLLTDVVTDIEIVTMLIFQRKRWNMITDIYVSFVVLCIYGSGTDKQCQH